MKAVVARLARKIKDALALRQRQEQKGRLDSRRTIRTSLQYGGVPMELRLRRRHREKPRLVTLCDVSDSVRNASRFMLQLVWSLQECFSRVRSYVFVSEIAEVTAGVQHATRWSAPSSGRSRARRSTTTAARTSATRSAASAGTELESLDRKTTVLILGDARNNYNDPQAWALRLIRERVKGIIWLNPEGQWGWGIGDSVMPLYAPPCDLVRSAARSPSWRRSSTTSSRAGGAAAAPRGRFLTAVTRSGHIQTMKTVRIADLKARLSEYLREVRRGRTFTVLDRETPIARLVPLRRGPRPDDSFAPSPGHRRRGRFPCPAPRALG